MAKRGAPFGGDEGGVAGEEVDGGWAIEMSLEVVEAERIWERRPDSKPPEQSVPSPTWE